MLERLGRVTLVVAACVVAAGLTAARAQAVALHALSPGACFEDAGLDGCATGTANEAPRLLGARGVAVSPDGRSVYVAASSDAAVTRFDRQADGALVLAGCFEDAGLDGCGTGAANETPGLAGATGVAVSPDGTSVYVTAVNDDAIVHFRRAPDGALTPAGCIEDVGNTECGVGATNEAAGLHGARGIAISADGASVYVGSSTVDAAIVRFDRAPDGTLTPAGCIEDTGLDGCGIGAVNETPGLNGIRNIAASLDGRSVYVASYDDDTVVRFDRAPGGALTPAGCFERSGDACGAGSANNVAGLGGSFGIAVSPDGASVYSASLDEHTLVRFARAADGSLTPLGCVEDAGFDTCGAGTANETAGLGGATGVAVSADGASVLVAGNGDGSAVAFTRALDGSLSPAGCLEDVGRGECGAATLADAAGLAAATGIAISPDGASVYAGASGDDAIVQLDREVPPVCRGTAVSGAFGAAVTVPLDCIDPNGDARTLRIASAPRHGTLGAIDQAAGAVVYTPEAGFAGSDFFSFSAAADGKSGELATAVIQVADAQGAGPPGPAGPAGAAGVAGAAGATGPVGPVAFRVLALLGDDRYRVRAGRTLRVRFSASAAGRAQLDLRKAGKAVRTARRTLRSGATSTLAISTATRRSGAPASRRLRPGAYTLRLTFTAANGQRATDGARVQISR